MAKRSTRIEVTKIYHDGHTEVNLNKNKMNRKLCEELVGRLSKDWSNIKDKENNLKDVIFKCID